MKFRRWKFENGSGGKVLESGCWGLGEGISITLNSSAMVNEKSMVLGAWGLESFICFGFLLFPARVTKSIIAELVDFLVAFLF